MPEPATATPPPAAAAPPAPAPETPPAPKPTAQADPFIARVLGDMGIAVKDGKLDTTPPKAPEPIKRDRTAEFTSMGELARFKKERAELAAETPPAPKAEEKPAAPSPAEAPKAEAPTNPPTPPPAKSKIIVEKARPLEELVEGVVRRVTQDQKPTAAEPKADPPKVEDPDSEFLSSLDDGQRDVLELSRFAAKAMPDKHAALPKKVTEYFKKVEAKIAEKLKEDPDWNAESDRDFREWVDDNKPISDSERRKLEREQIKAEVRADVEKDFKPKLEEADRRNRVQEIRPEVDKAADSYASTVAQRLALGDKSPFASVMKVISEKGNTEEAWAEAQKVDPLAAVTAKNYLGQASSLGREYIELVSGVAQQVEFNPKLPVTAAQNKKAITQQRLFEFIDSQEAIFAKDGGDMRIVNGKSFVTRRELSAMPPAEQAKHWTLGHEDVLDMLAVAASTQATLALKTEVERRESEGYTKNGKHQATKKEDAPPPPAPKKEESPRAATTTSPGAGNLAPPQSAPTLFSPEDLKRQWEGGHRTWPG